MIQTVDAVDNPLVPNGEVSLVSHLVSPQLVDAYREQLKVEVIRFFANQSEVAVYQCLQTGYRFFHPFHLAGDGAFYEALQQHEWYYRADKWEYSEAEACLKPGDKVLEVGSGSGTFVRRLTQQGYTCVGLEINEDAVAQAQVAGDIDLRGESLATHAQAHAEQYDLVCGFQVLEHIAEVHSFLTDMIAVLKPGGYLAIAVPNNGSIVFSRFPGMQLRSKEHITLSIMNSPPHHMGLWDEASLRSLANLFSLKVVSVAYEPLYRGGRVKVSADIRLQQLAQRWRIPEKLLAPWLRPRLERYYDKNRKQIPGDTIFILYQKPMA
jgi:2-polyprenyl-3-methyl-5-hydroxy-6-metoxy-1,4-benzoquinol methylase